MPCAALTAWSALVTEGDAKAGDTVLLQGTGGVSFFALQFSKLPGAKVIIISSSDDTLKKTVALGADEGINYKNVGFSGTAISTGNKRDGSISHTRTVARS